MAGCVTCLCLLHGTSSHIIDLRMTILAADTELDRMNIVSPILGLHHIEGFAMYSSGCVYLSMIYKQWLWHGHIPGFEVRPRRFCEKDNAKRWADIICVPLSRPFGASFPQAQHLRSTVGCSNWSNFARLGQLAYNPSRAPHMQCLVV